MNRNQLIKNLKLNGIGIEIGVQQGWYSNIILSNSNLYLYLLDSWKHFLNYEDVANVSDETHLLRIASTIVNLRKHEGRYTLIRDNSVNGSNLFQDNFFDFVYIDANHSYESVKTDLEIWYPKVKTGGIIAGHDYLNKPPVFGVKTAVDEFFNNQIINTTDEDNFKTWYVKKQ